MDGEPSVSLLGALSEAHRRARRAGIATVGTDLVLYYAAVRVRATYGLMPGPRDHRVWRPVRRGTAGLVDPSPPEPARLTPAFDDDVAFHTAALLRLAACRSASVPMPLHRRGRRAPAPPAFSPAVQWAVYDALHEARRRGVRHPRPEHLVYAMLTLPGSAASHLLGHRRHTVLREVRAHPTFGRAGVPSSWAVDALAMVRAVRPDRDPAIWRWPKRLALLLLFGPLVFRPFRRHGARYGHPLLILVENKAQDTAAYTGHDRVTSAHLLLTVLELHTQLDAARKPLAPSLTVWNTAGTILAPYGIDRWAATRATARLVHEPHDDEDNRDGLRTKGWHWIRLRPGVPVHGRTSLLALHEASRTAWRLGHPYAGTTHLLASLLADPAGPAARLLRDLGVDPAAIHAEARAALGEPAEAPR